MNANMEILPDVLKPNLKIVFCGMAAGTRSVQLNAYYASIGNRFWKTLYEIRLTPILLSPIEYPLIINYNLGLTDLVKNTSGNDNAVNPTPNDIKILKDKILLYQPQIVAFNGKKSAINFLGRMVDYGLQKEWVGLTCIFVLPSTSNAALQYWDKQYWYKLERINNGIR
jgi:double-stranded uracil-DNA glycosylase